MKTPKSGKELWSSLRCPTSHNAPVPENQEHKTKPQKEEKQQSIDEALLGRLLEDIPLDYQEKFKLALQNQTRVSAEDMKQLCSVVKDRYQRKLWQSILMPRSHRKPKISAATKAEKLQKLIDSHETVP